MIQKLLLSFLAIFFLHVSYVAAQDCPIFPHPSKFVWKEGGKKITSYSTIKSAGLDDPSIQLLKSFWHSELKMEEGDFEFIKTKELGREEYKLRVDKKIRVEFSGKEGLYYALQSLKQLLFRGDQDIIIRKCIVEDRPKFAYRGMHLDVSRHFFTLDEVKKYLDYLAYYKFNTFHWHLTDDQGWRIEIKKYPKLTEIGSRRESTLVGHASNKPEVYDKVEEKGFYTQEEIKEIVKYAADRQITVIPEIEMPGHARAALAAYPEYSCDGKALPVANKWGVFDHVYCSKYQTRQFLKDILAEVIELFPSTLIHIGGDEVPKTKWKECPSCQGIMVENQLKSEEELQAFFLRDINTFLTAKGKTMIGWDEILEGKTLNSAVIMRWRGEESTKEALDRGLQIVQTPNAHLYFDHYQSKRPSEPLAIGGFSDLQEVFEYSPIPTYLEGDKRKLILGAQANVWTEYMADFEQVEYMIFPRIIALSEVLWSENKTSYQEFKNRLIAFQIPRLEAKGIAYSKALFETTYSIYPKENGIKLVFNPSVENSELVLSGGNKKKAVKNEFQVLPSPQKQELEYKLTTLKDGQEIDELSFKVSNHAFLGKKWTCWVEPSSYYQGTNDIVLSDGIEGRRPWHGAEWLGFRDSVVEFTMDLKEKTALKTIEVGFLESQPSWIYLPRDVELFYSKNGRRWKSIKASQISEKTVLKINADCRFLKLRINQMPIINGGEGKGQKPWLFMDEIVVEIG